MSNEQTDLGALLADTIETALDHLGVSMPATVLSYDRASQTARVRPGLTSRIISYTDEDVSFFEAPPDIPNVPVCWSGGGASYFHPDLTPGEGVTLIVSDADFSTWLRTGKQADPKDTRTHHYGKCVAIPGLRPRPARLPSTPVILAVGGQTESMALAGALRAMLQGLATTLSSSPDTAVAAVGSALNTALSGANFASTLVKSGG